MQWGISFLIQSIYYFLYFLYLKRHLIHQVRQIFFSNFVENIFCVFNLRFSSFLYSHCSKILSFDNVPDFPDAFVTVFVRFNISIFQGIHSFCCVVWLRFYFYLVSNSFLIHLNGSFPLFTPAVSPPLSLRLTPPQVLFR